MSSGPRRSAVVRVAAALALAAGLALPGCFHDNGSVTAPGPQVPIVQNFGSKIVYGTSRRLDVSLLRAHCADLGGTFNECGTICAPGAQACAAVCAFTCENIPD